MMRGRAGADLSPGRVAAGKGGRRDLRERHREASCRLLVPTAATIAALFDPGLVVHYAHVISVASKTL